MSTLRCRVVYLVQKKSLMSSKISPPHSTKIRSPGSFCKLFSWPYTEPTDRSTCAIWEARISASSSQHSPVSLFLLPLVERISRWPCAVGPFAPVIDQFNISRGHRSKITI